MEERTHHQRNRTLHEEFKRRIKTQTVLPSAETAAMLFWALLASGQITLRKVDGWQTLDGHLAQPIGDQSKLALMSAASGLRSRICNGRLPKGAVAEVVGIS